MNATRRLIEQARAILEPYFQDDTNERRRSSAAAGSLGSAEQGRSDGAWLTEEDAQSLRRILRQLVQLTKGKA